MLCRNIFCSYPILDSGSVNILIFVFNVLILFLNSNRIHFQLHKDGSKKLEENMYG